MLDPRIYRSGLAVVVLAVLVLAFSLEDQRGALTSPLAPDAFNGQNVASETAKLARDYPRRPPGSAADDDIATQIVSGAQGLAKQGYTVSTDTFPAQTADGERAIENVVAVRPGSVQSGSLVIVASRDARGSPATATASATATLLELGRDLAGETLRRTVVLASTSGSQGMAGALRLAARVAGPVDAVLVVGDIASRRRQQPIVVPWSRSPQVADPLLRNTVGAQLRSQASVAPAQTSLWGQYLHLAFPLTLSGQSAFGDLGIPAVYVSLTGERGAPPGGATAGVDQISAVGRSLLATISALDAGPEIPASSAYVLLDGKVVPGWALSVFVLALIVPVALTAIDALARARRRGHPLWRWSILTLAASIPFLLVAVLVLLARLAGLIPFAPPGPTGPGTIPTPSGGWAVLVVGALIALGTIALLRPVAVRVALPKVRTRGPGRDTATEGATAGLLVVACVVTVLLWLVNPFAALLVVPGLHLWLLALSPDLRMPRSARALFVLLGLLPLTGVALYYATTLHYTPLGLLWMLTVLIAGHGIGFGALLVWSLFGGCVLTAVGVLIALARQPRPEQEPVTVRGPVGYAGPGSLGGTPSALSGTRGGSRPR